MSRLFVCVAIIVGAFALGYWGRWGESERSTGAVESHEESESFGRKHDGDFRHKSKSSPAVPRTPGVGVDRSSGGEAYDPERVLELGASMKELYEAEELDSSWAPNVEQHVRLELQSAFETLLDGTVEDFDVECRTASCMVTYTVEPSERDRAFAFQQWLPFADAMQPWQEPLDEKTGRNRVGMRLTFFGDRDLRVLTRRFQNEFTKRFPKGLEALRAAVDEHGLGGAPE